ncbi:ABC transporter ATP-binding protein [Dethiobacter alkaliphilus]|uniref:ABC transporter related protein n=1 Tax=Dethiobacter alkaliphilus AHT 1 TaxID=555088 RepID=C0GFG6_DETAL|nr:ABC transporter ATP-binding protein [Dethiobacter alkaliphilus]EEG77926.1 ABC transporter related protein [Dethiobacter alkaliphilus AHT 1]
MTVLETRELTKYYGKFLALNKVNLNLERGEVLGFIGPNGAGKTTAIRILLGLLRKSSGEAKLFGQDAWKDAVEIHRRLAYVPGDVHLWPNLTGGEVIDLYSKLRGDINQQRRAEMLKRFDLDPTKKCSTYSKGNRQKVALVAAFASDAELFILDEPTSGLDPLMASVFQDCVAEKKQEGRTVLMSSHILADVEKLCDRVSIIRHGEIVETGTLTELRHLTRTMIAVETAHPLANLEKMGGVYNVNKDGNRANFHVESNRLDEIMQYLVQFGIRSLTSTPPTLEELFMRHYSEELDSLNGKAERSA